MYHPSPSKWLLLNYMAGSICVTRATCNNESMSLNLSALCQRQPKGLVGQWEHLYVDISIEIFYIAISLSCCIQYSWRSLNLGGIRDFFTQLGSLIGAGVFRELGFISFCVLCVCVSCMFCAYLDEPILCTLFYKWLLSCFCTVLT